MPQQALHSQMHLGGLGNTTVKFTFRHENTPLQRRSERGALKLHAFAVLYSAYTNIPRPQTGIRLALFADDMTRYYVVVLWRTHNTARPAAMTSWFQPGGSRLTPGALTAHWCPPEVPTRIETSDFPVPKESKRTPPGESRADGISISIGRVR
ncbi:hypothetical protein EVAR_100025_1 [Eumeta japonica]|uniref:Uncharacterized protein n=1 Tax=Eumeta variegata TaxID=151549 RepID=A0A4C1ZL29_EUMVA|nr:hypothetical protein EVAR_100025_1 [Eumeta japonica]